MKSTAYPATRIVSCRIPILVVFAVLLGVCVPGLFRLNVTVNLDDYFLQDDPVTASLEDFHEVFPVGDFIGVLVEAPDVFAPASLELIHRIGISLESAIPNAGSVTSLATMDGTLTSGAKLVFDGNRLASPREDVESVRLSAARSPLLNGSLFSGDFREAWVLVALDPDLSAEDDLAAGRAAWNALGRLDVGEMRITPSGVPIVTSRKQAELSEDLVRVLLFAGFGAIVLSSVILRSFYGVLGTLSVFAGSVVLVLGIQGWAGTTVDSGFLGVPILLTMGISIGYTVHIHRFYRLEIREKPHRIHAVAAALRRTVRPIFFTALTTMAALSSFLFVDVRPIRWVGYTSAFAIVAAFVLSVTLFPSFLSLGRDREDRADAGEPRFLEPMYRAVSRLCHHRGKAILVIFIAAGLISLVGGLRMQVDFDAVAMMGTRLPHMEDQIRVGESEIAIGEYMNLMLTLPDDGFSRAESIRRIADLETRLNGIEGIKRVTSITTILGETNSLLHRRQDGYDGLPDHDVSLEALLRLVDGVMPENRNEWLDDSNRHARLFIEVSDFSSRRIEQMIDAALLAVDESFPSGTAASVSGSTYQVAMMNQYITRGLLRSVGTALLTISVIMILVFRSLRWGLVAMIPNVFPVMAAGAILGFAGIPLEFVTMTVAPIVLGLAVDDTIHFMSFLREDLPVTGDFHRSLEKALRSVGAAITETTIILCVSFLIFTVSRVNSIRYMGIIAAAGMAAAYLADLLVVPVLVKMLQGPSEAMADSRIEPSD